MRRALALSAAVLAAACASTPPEKPAREATPIVGAVQAPGAILYTWTQIVPGGTLARAVVEGPGQPCPEIVLDGLPGVDMTSRPNLLPERGSYPITVCEHPLVLPDGRPASRAQVADRLLPLPGDTPARIAVIGAYAEERWPLASIAKTIARRQMPTLVVHVGDDHYASDTWDQWKREFFEPAGELLQVAPWLMVGENREDSGWLYLLGPPHDQPDQDPSSHAIRLYDRFLKEVGEDHGSLLVVWKGSNSWDATLSTPKGDETRTCRFDQAGFDCGISARR